MISRKSAKSLAEAYHSAFSYAKYDSVFRTETHVLKREALYDFLYENDYEASFLNAIENLSKYDHPRELKEFLMKLHTGESLANATPNWAWEQRQKLGQRYLKDLAEDIIKTHENERQPTVDRLKSQLELDGFIYKDGILYFTESSVIDEKEEQSYLENLLSEVSLPDIELIKHHIGLAEDDYLNSRWGNSIGNSRKFLEAILQRVAEGLSIQKYGKNLGKQILDRPASVRDFLEGEKLIEKREKQAIAKIYSLLSDTGAHPYMAEKDQARLMWHLALTFSQFVLLRYKGYLTSRSG